MNAKESEIFKLALREDFYTFLKQCFDTLNPGTPFEENWHIRAMAGELEAVARGDNRRLILNMPPRSLKSIATSVALVAWYLGHHPSKHVICASYAADLSEKFAFDCRKIMTSAWYEAVFVTRVDRTKSTRHDFFTIQGGSRLATSVNGPTTGRGADLVVIDDPSKPEEMLSDALRESVNRWFGSTLFSRLNNKTTGRIVLAMQRLHVDDLTGHLLRQDGEAWRHLRFAAIAETDEHYEIRRFNGKMSTHIRKEGELLHPEREPQSALDAIKLQLGNYLFHAQYQQNPILPDGNIVNIKLFSRYDQLPDRFSFILQSWDTASKAGELNDYSVGTTWGIDGEKNYLLHVYRAKLEYPDLKRAVIAQAKHHQPHTILIEDTAAGIALLQELRQEGLYNIKAIKADKEKILRMRAQTGLIDAGRVYLPEKAPWLAAYENEMMLFPVGPYDDQVDSTAQALAYIQGQLQEPALTTFYRELNEERARKSGGR